MKRLAWDVTNLGIFLIAAEVLIRIASVPRYIVPPPSAIAEYIFINRGELATHAGMSLGEAFAGVGGALTLGTALAFLSFRFLTFGRAARPTLTALQSVPILAFAPLVNTWLGPGFASKAALSLLVCLPVVVITISEGLGQVPKAEVELFRSLRATFWQTVIHLRIPRARPYFGLALQLAIPLGILGAIVGEFVGASQGLGFLIMRASYYVRTEEMFAAAILAGISSVVFVKLLNNFARLRD